MVTGGKRDWYFETDSTEIYRDSAWSVLPSAALPSPTFYLSSGKINDTIFVIGISILLKVFFFYFQCYSGGIPTVGILRFNSVTEKWEDVGRFKRHDLTLQAGFSHFNILT